MVEVVEKGQVKYFFIGKNYWDELFDIVNKNCLQILLLDVIL